MRRQTLGTLLWLFLLPVAGALRLLQKLLRIVLRVRGRTLASIVALAVVMRTPNPFSAQFSLDAFKPIGPLVLSAGALVLGVAVLVLGVRAPISRKVRRVLRRRGYFVGAGAPSWQR
jgi:hypothetical protein